MPPRKIGIIAGGGILPKLAVDAAKKQDADVFVVILDGHGVPADFRDVEHTMCRLGAVGSILAALQSAEVQEVCLIGTVRRPSLAQLRPDRRAFNLIARYGFSGLGDDALLRSVGDVLTKEGLRLVAVQDLVGGLLLRPGSVGSIEPTEAVWPDIEKGLKVARQLGVADVGQAVVIQQGIVLAVEAIEGTDRLIARSAQLAYPGRGPILVKCCKPQQDQRLDLPTIGPDTVRSAASAGFSGIAAEAGRTLVADIDNLRLAADAAGLFVYGFADGDVTTDGGAAVNESEA